MDATAVAMYGIKIGAITSLVAATLGVIAVLVSTFLAEPLKIKAQNKAKADNLRLALYKEMVFNFLWLDSVEHGDWDTFSELPVTSIINQIEPNLRRECYEQAINGQLETFYQLKESILFHNIYSTLSDVPRTNAAAIRDRQQTQQKIYPAIYTACRVYVITVAQAFDDGRLDKEFLRKAVDELMSTLVIQRAQHYREWSLEGEG